MINLKSKIYLAGHKGLVGSSILRKLRSSGYKNIIFKSRKQLDLKNQKKVLQFLKKKYDHVSNERVVSGYGIEEIYNFILSKNGKKYDNGWSYNET